MIQSLTSVATYAISTIEEWMNEWLISKARVWGVVISLRGDDIPREWVWICPNVSKRFYIASHFTPGYSNQRGILAPKGAQVVPYSPSTSSLSVVRHKMRYLHSSSCVQAVFKWHCHTREPKIRPLIIVWIKMIIAHLSQEEFTEIQNVKDLLC